MASNIKEVYKMGNSDGHFIGYEEGEEAGKKAEQKAFWENYNLSGQYAFAGQGWNKENFKPNRDFNVGQSGFLYHNWLGTAYDLAQQLENLGVSILKCNKTRAFDTAWFTRLPVIDISNQSGTFDRTFSSASGSPLVTIDKIILPSEGKVSSFNNTFGYCSKLKNVTFEGVIDKSINFSVCPLSVTSLKSIITHLKNYAGSESEYSYTVTFKTSAFETLEAEGATSPNGNTWAEYIDDLKWNLTLA